MGARDDGSGSPCRCSLRLRRRVPGPCPLRAPAAHERQRAGRASGLPGGARDELRPPVPRPGRARVAGLVSAAADQSQYNRRLRGLVELISLVQQRLARWLDAAGAPLADATQLAVANYAGCQQRSHFAGLARYGYARSQHRFIWGVRLVLLTDERGLLLGYTVVAANEKEYEPLADLLTGTPAEVVIADKGFWGRGYRERLAADGLALLTPDKTRTARNAGHERALASSRLVIESVFANLTSSAILPRHPPVSPCGSRNASS